MNETTSWVIGVDLSDRKMNTCRFNPGTGEIVEGKCATTAEAVSKHFRGLEARLVALEVGTHSRWFSRQLVDMGFKVVIANPRRVALISQNDMKTDRGDALLLARLAAADPQLLHPVSHRGDVCHADLAVIKARQSLVEVRTKLINTVRGLVKCTGSRIPSVSADAFAKRAREHVPTELRHAVGPLITQIGVLTQRIKAYEQRINKLAAEKYPETARLAQVPGVGPITSLAFVLSIEDPGRFARSRSVGAFFGLRPRLEQSGMVNKQLRITKAGDVMVRNLLVNCAHYILGPFGPDSDLRRWGLRLAERGGGRGKKRAIIAVARKLAVLLHSLWSSGSKYEPLLDKISDKQGVPA